MNEMLFWIIVVGIVCNVACAILGCFLVLRRMSMMGDAISHGVLPGIAIGFLFNGQLTGWALLLGAVVFGMLTAFFTQTIVGWLDVSEDAGMGIVFTSLFAIGVLIIAAHPQVDLDPKCVFEGSIQRVPLDVISVLGFEVPAVLPWMLATLLVTVMFVTVFWKELKIVAFDAELATAMGLNANVMHYLLMAMVSAVTVTAFSAIGSILVIAMLIVPAVCGSLLSDRLLGMVMWAVGVAIASSLLGTILTPGDGNVPGMMVIMAGILLLFAVLLAPRHGIAARVIHNARLGVRIVAEDILANLYRRDENPSAVIEPVPGGFIKQLALWSLRRGGAVTVGPKSELALTTSGRERAESLVRAHRLWEAYLDKNFDLPRDHLHDPATRMEHFITTDLQKELAAELQEPGVDPHGRAIPPLEKKHE